MDDSQEAVNLLNEWYETCEAMISFFLTSSISHFDSLNVDSQREFVDAFLKITDFCDTQDLKLYNEYCKLLVQFSNCSRIPEDLKQLLFVHQKNSIQTTDLWKTVKDCFLQD
jgi:hypothetical protein